MARVSEQERMKQCHIPTPKACPGPREQETAILRRPCHPSETTVKSSRAHSGSPDEAGLTGKPGDLESAMST